MALGKPNHVPIYSGGHKYKIWSQQFLHQWKWDGSCLINNHKFSLIQFNCICWMNVLAIGKKRSSVIAESYYVDTRLEKETVSA